jgi:pSer/pThr/pTyr-binding forkhead associated (FHA) protein
MKQMRLYDWKEEKWYKVPLQEVGHVGRDEENDLTINVESEKSFGKHISRLHCIIYQDIIGNENPKIGNCSKNGTSLDYVSVPKNDTMELYDKCNLRLADYKVYVEIKDKEELNKVKPLKKNIFSNFAKFFRK